MGRLLVGLLWVGMSAAVGAQDPLYFLPADNVTVRVIRELSSIDVAPGVHVRTVVGPTSSMSIGDFEPGSAAVLHHHTREQADVGLTGTFDMTIGTHEEKLGPDMGVVVPANVAHSIANKGTSAMTVIEFHTIPRPDLVPPRPVMTFPSSPEAVPVPDSKLFVARLDTPGAGTLLGRTCTMSWRRLDRGAKPAEIRAADVERLIYVMRGTIQLDDAKSQQSVSAGSVIMLPAHQQLRVQASTAGVALVDFAIERK